MLQELVDGLEQDACRRDDDTDRFLRNEVRRQLGLETGTAATTLGDQPGSGRLPGITLLPLRTLSAGYTGALAALDTAASRPLALPQRASIRALLQAMSDLYEASQQCVDINRAGNPHPASLTAAAGHAADRIIKAVSDEGLPPQLRRLACALLLHSNGHRTAASVLWTVVDALAAHAPADAARLLVDMVPKGISGSRQEDAIRIIAAHPDLQWRTRALANHAYSLEWTNDHLGQDHLRLVDLLCTQLAATGVRLSVEQAFGPLLILQPYLARHDEGDAVVQALDTMTRVIEAAEPLPAGHASALGNWISSSSLRQRPVLELVRRLHAEPARASAMS